MSRLLAFRVAVSAIVALAACMNACAGIAITDPSVRPCHDDTTVVVTRFPDGQESTSLVIRHDDPMQCRPTQKAA